MFTFKKEYFKYPSENLSSRITVETDDVSLEEVIESIKQFLLACGYSKDALNEYFIEDEVDDQ